MTKHSLKTAIRRGDVIQLIDNKSTAGPIIFIELKYNPDDHRIYTRMLGNPKGIDRLRTINAAAGHLLKLVNAPSSPYSIRTLRVKP